MRLLFSLGNKIMLKVQRATEGTVSYLWFIVSSFHFMIIQFRIPTVKTTQSDQPPLQVCIYRPKNGQYLTAQKLSAGLSTFYY